MHRFANRYTQVISTYLRRPLFQRLLAALVVTMLAPVELRWHWDVHGRTGLLTIHFLLDLLAKLLPWFVLIAFSSALTVHLRAQLAHWRASLIPRFKAPHLVVAGGLFMGVAAAIAFTLWMMIIQWIPDYASFSVAGMAAIVLTLMTLSAVCGAFRSGWLAALLLPALLFFAITETRIDRIIDGLVWGYVGYGTREFWREARFILLALDALALTGIGLHLSRAGTDRAVRTFTQTWNPTDDAADAGPPPAHLTAGFSAAAISSERIEPHLRHAPTRARVMGPWGPWAFGGVLALVLLLIPTGREQGGAIRSLLLASLGPALAVALVWRERWPSLGYESLFPLSATDFVRRVGWALAADIGEFWLASTIAGVLALLAWDRESLGSAAFVESLLASALMQCLVFGALFCALRTRSWSICIGALCALIVLIAAPFAITWSSHPMLTFLHLIIVALIEMLAGFVLAGIGYRSWRKGHVG